VSDPRVWGATAAERDSPFGCDALGFVHDDAYFRALDVAAPPELVYRWLCQLRVAPYSYDWLDNFGRRSPRERDARNERIAPGQRMMTLFELVRFRRGRELTVRCASRAYAAVAGDLAGSYRVDPRSGGVRLIAKVLIRYPGGPLRVPLRAAIPWLDLIMFRKQLRTLRALAEREARGGLVCGADALPARRRRRG